MRRKRCRTRSSATAARPSACSGCWTSAWPAARSSPATTTASPTWPATPGSTPTTRRRWTWAASPRAAAPGRQGTPGAGKRRSHGAKKIRFGQGARWPAGSGVEEQRAAARFVQQLVQLLRRAAVVLAPGQAAPAYQLAPGGEAAARRDADAVVGGHQRLGRFAGPAHVLLLFEPEQPQPVVAP